MRKLKKRQFILIGLDGGASKISAWKINFNDSQNLFSLTDCVSLREYRHYPSFQDNFTPVDLQIQLSEQHSSPALTPGEEAQSQAYIAACTDVLKDQYERNGRQPLLVGIGMPGLKTTDLRGIAVLANGPRMPDYAQNVEQKLSELKVELVQPFARIGSDADYCGMGEEYSAVGGFKDVKNAYYLGGGTGAADALKLKGRLLLLDQAKDWIAKTWELKNDRGLSFECYASAGGIQFIYSQYSNISVEKLNDRNTFPPQILSRAVAGEKAAIETLDDVSTYLAQLLFDRISAVYCGSLSQLEFINPARSALLVDHPFRGTLIERIVIGQRLGELLASPKSAQFLLNPLLRKLGDLIRCEECLEQTVKEFYLTENHFNPHRLVISSLREAPALGAGIDAYRSYKGLSI